MDQPQPDHDLTPVAEALFRGQKIEAIKLYRESRRVGLKEAKDAVEELEAGLRERSPEKFANPSSRTGCFACLQFLLATLTIAGMLAVLIVPG